MQNKNFYKPHMKLYVESIIKINIKNVCINKVDIYLIDNDYE